jgi:hypothetical protein
MTNKDKAKTSPRIVVYVNLWGDIKDTERDELIAVYTQVFTKSKVNARMYEYGRNANNAAIVAVRFNGADIDLVADCLDITAGDLLSGDVALAVGAE